MRLADVVNLTLDEVAGDRSFGPAFGNHCPQPETRLRVGQYMHPKVGGVPHGFAIKRFLKLGPCFELDHGR